VLLFRHKDPSGTAFWATPGGGLEPGESFEQAARREALEELGVAVDTVEAAGERDAIFPWGDRMIRQSERYFRIRVATAGLERVVTASHAVEGIHEVRWWSPEELDVATELVWPADLASRVRALGGA
jgi:ADP-ribose pyrophosphatase YjhB (NUDIX family)